LMTENETANMTDLQQGRRRRANLHGRVVAAKQDPAIRITNFNEVSLGLSMEQAVLEAQRCLHCRRARCTQGCPVNVDIAGFIGHIADGDISAAYEAIVATNILPAICGRVCPQESQCEVLCVLARRGGEPIAIGNLERFAADWQMGQAGDGAGDGTPAAAAAGSPAAAAAPASAKVAVVGAGPASLTCSSDLARLGYQVSVLEAFHAAGGVLTYGIPEFRLPKAIVARELQNLDALGVEIKTNIIVGRTVGIDELLSQGYQAVFIGSGAGLPSFLGIPGENLLGVYSANEYLTRINLMKAYADDYDTPVSPAAKVAVIGGGNVAMDAARCARRLGAEVMVVYRRGLSELPARVEEVHHAMEEGVGFCFLATPLAIHGDEKRRVTSIECQRMELGEPDESGRQRPVTMPGSEFSLDVDAVVVAIGTSPNPLVAATTEGLATGSHGGIVADASGATTKPGVFAGGDIVTGSATVIQAMGAGKASAAAIDRYIRGLEDPWG
jgi:glutamate synthase (NADPH/NADH) small chain